MCGMKSDFDWIADTPAELSKVVSHLKSIYALAESDLSSATMYMCFRYLHKDAGLQKDEEAVFAQYAGALKEMRETASPSVRYRVGDLRNRVNALGQTASVIFASFTQIRSIFLETQVLHTFQELLAIAGKQRHLLQIGTADWARAQIESLRSDHAWNNDEWVRGACDRLPYNFPGAEYGQWRAPTFLIMNPLGDAAYDPERAWERQDEAASLECLKKFDEELEWRLRGPLDKAEGEARLAEAKRFALVRSKRKSINLPGNQIAPSAEARSPERDSGFTHSDDYRSVRFEGESHSLSHHQAIMVGILHKAHLAGHPDVPKAKLLAAVEAETSAVRDFFRNSALWRTLVCPSPRRGSYRIGLGLKK
jgi:hypothetical protein